MTDTKDDLVDKSSISGFSGFYKKSLDERARILMDYAQLTDKETSALKNTGALSLETANQMVENCIGGIHLPLGIATNFKINKKNYVVPMAIEEPSVIAAASRAAKFTLPAGFYGEADEPIMRGQVQLVDVNSDAEININKYTGEIESRLNKYAAGMEQYGGGYRYFSTRRLQKLRGVLLFEFFVNVSDAMGANTVNSIAEKIAPYLEDLTGGKVRLRILSNLATERMVRVKAVWKKKVIGEEGVKGVYDGFLFANNDVYRATTNNKGILNGVDAVLLATGNDWRAVEAGAHAYASFSGDYRPLAKYTITRDGDLEGYLEMPLAVATVGGATGRFRTAEISRKILNVKSSRELAMVVGAVGLANNFAALYVLSTEGIQKGHMRLHSRNIAVMAGAKTSNEINLVAQALYEKKDYSLDFARSIIKGIREGL